MDTFKQNMGNLSGLSAGNRAMTNKSKILPWMLICAEEVHKQYPYIIGDTRDTLQTLAAIIAAHAPNHEWEAKEKALREFLEDAKLYAVDCVPEEYTLRRLEQKYLKGDNYSAGQYELAEDAIAILNREQEKP